MTLKKKIWIGGIILVLIIGGWYWQSRRSKQAPLVTETVQKGTVRETVSVTGTLKPVEYADLSFQAIGVVDAIQIKEGDVVKKGDTLATLDRTTLQSKLNAARIAAAKAVEDERLARREKVKSEELKARKLLSEAAREDVRTLLSQFDEYALTAPFDGVVTRIDLRVGETATIGGDVLRIVRDPKLEIEARVPESDIVKLSVGMSAQAAFDALTSSDVFGTKVTSMDTVSTVVQDVVSYKTLFTLDNQDSRLKDGMTTDVDIVTGERTGVLILPFRALSTSGDTTTVQVIQPDGSQKKVEVKTGLEGDEGTVEILSGLREGDQVVITTVAP